MGAFAESFGPPAQAAPGAEDEGRSLLGFLSNLTIGGLSDLATGIRGLAGQAIHDVGRGVALAIPGEQALGPINDVDPTGFHLDEIITGLPGALVSDLGRRYGSLLPGGAPASEAFDAMYEEPLSYVLDALAVGGAAAGAGKVLGARALSGTEAATTAERVAEALRLAGMGRKAEAAGIRVGLDELAEAGQLGGGAKFARSVLPSPTVRRAGERLEPFAPSPNPVGRALAAPFKRLGTEPLDVLRGQADELSAGVHEAVAAGREVAPPVQAQLDKLNDLIAGAEGAGVTRLQKPIVSKALEWNAVRKTIGQASAEALRHREERMGQVTTALRPYYRADRTFADRSIGTFDGLDIDIAELPKAEWAAGISGRVATPKAVSLGGGVRTALEMDLAPELRTAIAAQGPLAAQLGKVDELAQGVRSWLDDVTADPSKLREGTDIAAQTDAAERYLSGLYDALRRRLAHERGDAVIPDTVLAQDDMRLVLADWQGKMLDRGGDVAHIMERAYRPLGLKHGGKIENGKYVGPDWRELDDALRAAGIPQPVYFPMIDAEQIARRGAWDFLTNRSRVGARRASRDPHLLQMKGTLLERGGYVDDPIEAYGRRAARAVKAEELQSLIDKAIKPFARPVSSIDELTPGEAIYAPDGLWRFWRNKTTFDDVMDDLLSQGVEADGAIADALKSVVFRNQDELVQMGTTGKGLELYAIPKALARQLDSYAKWSGAISNPAVRLFWDKPMDVWRATVLQGSPRWILNNTLGNTVFVTMTGGAKVRDVLRIAEDQFKRYMNERLGTHFNTEVLDRIARLEGIGQVGSGFSSKESLYQMHLGKAGEGTVGEAYRLMSNSAPVRAARKYGSANLRFNSVVEQTFRQATYIRGLERASIVSKARPVAMGFDGLRKRLDNLLEGGISPGRVKSAYDEMLKVMGDYGALGPFERNVVRRFLFPFWGFYRHQARLLVTFPVEHPGRAAILERVSDVNREMMEQYGPVPEWLEGAVALGPPGPDTPFLTTRGPDPFSASFEPPTSMLSPPIKIALEQATGRSLFTGEEFTDPDVVSGGPFSDERFRVIRDDQGNVVDVEPIERVLPGILEHLLQQIPQYEALKSAVGGGATYDTATLLDVLKGAGVYTDETGAPRYPTNVAEQIAKISGLSTLRFDLPAYQQRLAEDALAALSMAQGGAA